MISSQIPVFKRITLGKYQTWTAYKDTLRRAKCVVDPLRAEGLLREAQKEFYQTPLEVDLYVLSGKMVGFGQPAYYETLSKVFLGLGFDPCVMEVAPALRLAHRSPKGESLILMMKGVEIMPRTPRTLCVHEAIEMQRIGDRDAYPTQYYDPLQEFLVMRRVTQ